jgi:hypothetical protein
VNRKKNHVKKKIEVKRKKNQVKRKKNKVKRKKNMQRRFLRIAGVSKTDKKGLGGGGGECEKRGRL